MNHDLTGMGRGVDHNDFVGVVVMLVYMDSASLSPFLGSIQENGLQAAVQFSSVPLSDLDVGGGGA